MNTNYQSSYSQFPSDAALNQSNKKFKTTNAFMTAQQQDNEEINDRYNYWMHQCYERQFAIIQADIRVQHRNFELKRDEIIERFEAIIRSKLVQEPVELVTKKLDQYRLQLYEAIVELHSPLSPPIDMPIFNGYDDGYSRKAIKYIDDLNKKKRVQHMKFDQQLNCITNGYETIIHSISIK